MTITATGTAAPFLAPRKQSDGSWALILTASPPATGTFDLMLTEAETGFDSPHVTHLTVNIQGEAPTLADLSLSSSSLALDTPVDAVVATISGVSDLSPSVTLLANPNNGATNIGTLYGFDEPGMPKESGWIDIGSIAQQISFVWTGGCYSSIILGAKSDGTVAVIQWELADGSPTPEHPSSQLIGVGGPVIVDRGIVPSHNLLPTDISAGDVVTAVLDHTGNSYLLINGIKIEGSETGEQTVEDSQTYALVRNNYGCQMQDVTYGPLAQPLSIVSQLLSEDNRPVLTISYYNADNVAPTGYEIQYETVNHATVLRTWTDAVILSSSGAGNAVVEGAHALPDAYRGGQIAVRIRQNNNTSAEDVRNLAFPSVKRFGMNLEDVSYYAKGAGFFRDWQRRLVWDIHGGTYDGMTINDGRAGMERLFADGICDRNGNLLQKPPGAYIIQLGTVDHPALFEDGDRLLVVPAGNIIRDIIASGVMNVSEIGISFNTTHPQHDPAAGHYVVNFAPGSGQRADGSDRYHWLINFDVDAFVPGPISFRKVDDTSDLILTDEYVTACSNFQVLRLMNVMDANNGGIWKSFDNEVNWGFSREAILELINRTLAIPYFSFGFNTTPAVAAQFMHYFDQHVDAQVPYFLGDPSNEVWGGIASLTTEFALRSVYSGRGLGSGYGSGIDPANVYIPPRSGNYADDGIANGYESGIGTPLGVSIPSGGYVFSYISGGPNQGLFQAKRTTATTAALPTNQGGTITDNDDFHYVGDMRPGAAREYGTFGYQLQTAINAVCSRFKMLANIQPADPLGVDYGGTFGRQTLDFAVTENGADTWGSIVDGVAIAPYATFGDRTNIDNATAGTARVQAFHDNFAANAGVTASYVTSSFSGITAYFAEKNRIGAPYMAAYECGMEGVTWGNPPAGLIDDFHTYLNSDGCVAQLEGYYDGLFDAGCATVCAFTFGPDSIVGATSIPYGYYSHFESVTDTTSGRARADIATAAKYKALVS